MDARGNRAHCTKAIRVNVVLISLERRRGDMEHCRPSAQVCGEKPSNFDGQAATFDVTSACGSDVVVLLLAALAWLSRAI